MAEKAFPISQCMDCGAIKFEFWVNFNNFALSGSFIITEMMAEASITI
jgi:hypothetical protein